MIALQWGFIFVGALLLWAPALRWLAAGSLAIGYVFAYGNGQLDVIALLPILLLFATVYAFSSDWKLPLLILAHVLFVLLAAALFLHWLPGFHNPRVVGPENLTPDAVPFSMYLNLDKPLVGFCILLLAWRHIRLAEDWRAAVRVGAIVGGLTIGVSLVVALLTHSVTWAPKWPHWAWLWMANNLALVVLAEEAFFRGYLQGGLERCMRKLRHGHWIALSASALLFGIAHFAGGWKLMVLATLAGTGYGVAYRYGGLQAAVLTHFGFNLVHLGLFTYPMLAH